jgi:prepilin-type processing-associated H-X9-DG protein
MVLETARDLGPWPAGGTPTLRELEPDAARYVGPGMPFGGLHPRQTNVLYADGSARPMSDRTDGEVLRQMATLRR